MNIVAAVSPAHQLLSRVPETNPSLGTAARGTGRPGHRGARGGIGVVGKVYIFCKNIN